MTLKEAKDIVARKHGYLEWASLNAYGAAIPLSLLDEVAELYADSKVKNLNIPCVSTRTFRFADWVNGKHVDETFKAIDRDDAIRIMNEKYPKHEFALAQELF